MTAVLAVAEHRQGELRDVSHELVTAGRALADDVDAELHVAVVGGDSDALAEAMNRAGVDVVHTAAPGASYNHDIYVRVVESLAASLEPRYVLAGHTVAGMDYAPALATGLGLPLMTDVTGLAHDDRLVVTRETYGGKAETTLEARGDRAMVTIRPGEWPVTEAPGDARVESVGVRVDEADLGTVVEGFETVGDDDIDIADAEFIVAVGRGIEEEENLSLVETLVDALGATLASSRPLVDNGWLPPSRQVGQSGTTVAPDVYVAVGISGAVQHVAGMNGSETVVAVNEDPDAPIFDIADYGVVGDLFEVVPALTERVR